MYEIKKKLLIPLDNPSDRRHVSVFIAMHPSISWTGEGYMCPLHLNLFVGYTNSVWSMQLQ